MTLTAWCAPAGSTARAITAGETAGPAAMSATCTHPAATGAIATASCQSATNAAEAFPAMISRQSSYT
ncbi:hypothetical protein ACIBF1_21620 [Spirillospora sp. NPDC050679]